MTVFIKDLIDLPERVYKGDFVLKLTEGVARPEETLRDYVVTPQLVTCFADALGFIGDAVRSKTSKAAYLHGSFGSGKSHFMAVLHLILQGNTQARSIPELAPAIAKSEPWMKGKKFLLVPYHMIGSRNMESAILGGYARFVKARHPDAPIAGIYAGDNIFRDAGVIRDGMGDGAFFAALNKGKKGGGEWGDLETGWEASRYEAAQAAAPSSEERVALISDLVDTFFQSVKEFAPSQDESCVPLDDGLSIVSRHAAALGYHAVILFLDELILWLASHAADIDFVHREGQKLTKLVEAQLADRPIPLVSFVARQRDLAELVGDNVPGARRLNFSEALGHWEGRFHKITLEDRNLPAIAEKRVLRPKNEEARGRLDEAFLATSGFREDVMNTLLTRKYDRSIFRQVYPFSPALIDTLVGVSSVLQRERTALKVMLQILVEQRDTLRLGDIVPVGDLYDVIAHGDEAFSADMAIHFENARKLYHRTLLPVLEETHGITAETAEALPEDDRRRKAFHNDDRLVKTLLLAALVPGVESLKGLTAGRLAALNHGTIHSPIPGQENQIVADKCRRWAAVAGAIRVGDDSANPSITVELFGVDTEAIIEKARDVDTPGNRVRLVRQTLFDKLGIEDSDQPERTHSFQWNNTSRTCTVVFANLRTLPASSLANDAEDWKVIIDFPFDDKGRSPEDDTTSIETFLDAHPEGTRTLVWLPSFLSRAAQKDLGNLVILEHILAGERFLSYAGHLSLEDRGPARNLLDNQRAQLRERVSRHLLAAYGVELCRESVDGTHEMSDHFRSLLPGLAVQPVVSHGFADTLQNLLDQALRFQYPAHPKFQESVKRSSLVKVFEEVSRAVQHKDGRIEVEKALRPLMNGIAVPLKLGKMGDTHFVLEREWVMHFDKEQGREPGALTVSRLRQWLDRPKPMGLPLEAQNLILLVWAEQTHRFFSRYGAAVDATIPGVPGDAEAVEQQILPGDQWAVVSKVAGEMFGIAVGDQPTQRRQAELAESVKRTCDEHAHGCRELCRHLESALKQLEIHPNQAPRAITARNVHEIVNNVLQAGTQQEVLQVLGRKDLATNPTALGRSLKTAPVIGACLSGMTWVVVDNLKLLPGPWHEEGRRIIDSVKDAVASDEYVLSLADSLKKAQVDAASLIAKALKTVANSAEAPVEIGPAPPPGAVGGGQAKDLTVGEARKKLKRLEDEDRQGDLMVDLTWRFERNPKRSGK